MTDGTRRSAFPLRLLAIAAVLGAVAGAGAIYVKSASERNQAAASCKGNAEAVARMKPLAHGEVAGVLVPDAPRGLPDLTFKDSGGQPKKLADFAGKTVLLNLWATWCAPCREEMPALDRLQKELGGGDFEVVAVSIDTQDPGKARDFLKELKIENLAFYADPTADLFQRLKMAGRGVGLPTSLLIDGSGCEIGYLPGPANWASDDAKALVRAALGRS